MSFTDLQSFIEKIEEIGDLDRIKTQVDPYLATSAMINQACKATGPKKALLFEKVRGSRIPLVANLFGSEGRVAMALGVTDIDELVHRFRHDLAECKEKASGDALAQLAQMSGLESVSTACFAKNASAEGLGILPALHSWPGDGGRYLTLGQVFTRHPETDQQNCGMYRLQIIDLHTALLRCHPGSGGAEHLAAWQERGLAMPVAIALGGPPSLTWCAGVSLPDSVSEFQFTRYLTGQNIQVTQCRETGLLVPATAEIVIEGYIHPGEQQLEGPFGNHTGYYAPKALAPVLRVKRLSLREQAVYPCTVVGPPPMENSYLAQAATRLLLVLLQHENSWLTDLYMPMEGIYHRAALLAVDAPDISLPEISRVLRETLLLRNSRMIVLLDRDSDLRNSAHVYWRVVNADVWSKSVLIEGDKITIDARTDRQRDKIF